MTAAHEATISVALVTRNRPAGLKRVLSSLRSQEPQPFEVVVSDDSTEEEWRTANQGIASQFGCRYQAGPCRGLYANRNLAARACRGTHIRSMDDDQEFPPHHS